MTRPPAWISLSFTIAVIVVAVGINTVIVDHVTRGATPRDGGVLIDAGSLRANVRVQGAGPTVVLLHGLSAALDWWDSVAGPLAADHRVVSIDLLGHGGTAAPASNYGIKRQADLVAAILDELDIGRADVIGHSMGGDVATAFVEAHPKRVDSLVLIDCPPAATERYNLATELYLMPVVGELLSHLRANEAVRWSLSQAFAPGFKVPGHFVDDVLQVPYAALRSAHDESFAFRRAKTIVARLGAIRPAPPLLVIVGSLDPFVSPGSTKAFDQIPGANIVTLAGVGHSPMVEAPAETLAIIRSFLSTIHERP
ncbi:MAG TPA: alpha/beta fold hydrolase [Xanthobacteraceae bacterium]